MCTGVEIALIVTTVATVAAAGTEGYVMYEQAGQQKAAAKAEYQFAAYQEEVQRRQLQEDMETTRIQAMEQEGARTAEFRKSKALNSAAILASGLGSSMSFEQGTAPGAEDIVRRDLASLRLTTASTVSRLADQIAVSRTQLGYQKYGSKLGQRMAGIQQAGAAVGTAAKITAAGAGGYGDYQQYKTSQRQNEGV